MKCASLIALFSVFAVCNQGCRLRVSTRQELIFVKATANAQRRQREQFLRELPPRLAEPMGGMPSIHFPDTKEILHRFLPISPAGIGSPEAFRPAGYSFVEVASAQKAMELLSRPVACPEAEALLLLRPPITYAFQGLTHLVSELPIFRVEFGWASGVLPQLWPFARNCLALVQISLSRGAVIDSYCGRLEEDPNPAEVVFEVAVW